jgi:hypothetical protein
MRSTEEREEWMVGVSGDLPQWLLNTNQRDSREETREREDSDGDEIGSLQILSSRDSSSNTTQL